MTTNNTDLDRLLREVFTLCEATEDLPERKVIDRQSDFERGRRFEAKQIRKAIGIWFQDTFCGAAHMGEPAISAQPAPDGWVTWWPRPGGGHSPLYSHGPERPTYGPELDALLRIYPVYTRPSVT
jgi:hypothetical protein